MAGAGRGLFAYWIGFFIVTKAHVGWFFVHEIPGRAGQGEHQMKFLSNSISTLPKNSILTPDGKLILTTGFL
jgi:hypothetical protein